MLQDPSLSPSFSCLFLIFFGDLDPLSNYITWKGMLQQGCGIERKMSFISLGPERTQSTDKINCDKTEPGFLPSRLDKDLPDKKENKSWRESKE